MTLLLSGQLSQRELRELRRLQLVKEALDELKRKGIDADIQICPNCKSPRLVEMTSNFDLGYIGSFQPAYYCVDCGWWGRFKVVMSNRPEKDAVIEDLQETYPELLDDDDSHFDDDAFY
jgi:hypothetical protein